MITPYLFYRIKLHLFDVDYIFVPLNQDNVPLGLILQAVGETQLFKIYKANICSEDRCNVNHGLIYWGKKIFYLHSAMHKCHTA